MSQYQFQYQSTAFPVPVSVPVTQSQPQANTELDGKSNSNYTEDSSYDDSTTIGSESKKAANSETATKKTSKSAAGDDDGGDGEASKITFDWIVSNRLGEFGKYQKRIYFLLGLPAMVCAMHALSWVFLGANVNYRCQLDGEYASNATYQTLPPGHTFNDSFPLEKSPSGGLRWAQCEKYNESQFNDGKIETETNLTFQNNSLKRVSCDGKFVYDNSQYKTSARIDFKLICGDTYWYTVAETLFKSGILVGAFGFGSLSDRFGRRPIFFYALCQQFLCAILAALAPNYTVFVIARFLIGMANSGVFLVAFVIVMETIGNRKRMVAAIGMQFFFAIGWILVGCIAYFVRYWRYLQLTIALPGIFFLSYFWFMPESIRWLLANGKKEKAIQLLEKAAKENQVEISVAEFARLNEEKPTTNSIGIMVLRKYRKTLLRALNVFLCWCVNSGVYYGLAMNSVNLGGNDYINFILSALVEIPAYAFLLLTLNRYGRKRVLCTCMLLAGLFLVACGFIPEKNYLWLFITFNMVGKLFNAAAYAAIYMFSAELFPTVIRNSCMGISSVCARVGGIMGDYVILLHTVWTPLPHLIFGSACLVSGLLSLLLPETLGKRLPETMEDGEAFGTSAYT